MNAAHGLLCYSSENLGDEIQSIAASHWLPRIDALVCSEELTRDPMPEQHKLAMFLNGWFIREPKSWPPHEKIDPFLISFHISSLRRARRRLWRKSAIEVILAPANLDYLKKHGPVGARDLATLALLRKAGVESYHSGCLTLTLPSGDLAREDQVVACDVDDAMSAALKRVVGPHLVRTSHAHPSASSPHLRFAHAHERLNLYRRARAVVTSRVHCALPCLAFGTPVLFVPLQPDIERQQIALSLTHHCTRDDILRGTHAFDWSSPPQNPNGFRALRDILVTRCQAAGWQFRLEAPPLPIVC